jgi:type IV secretory pathway TraG/TraD family ATPase VirD4
MRLGQAIFFGTAAALLTLAAPTLARNSSANSHTATAADAPASASCHAYQQAADGSWVQLPCREMDSKATPQSRSATKSATERTQ